MTSFFALELIFTLLVLLSLSSPLSPFSAGCHLGLILVLWGLSHDHKMQSELFCSSATWGNHPAVLLNPEGARCLCSISRDLFVGKDQPGSQCGMSTAKCSMIIGHLFSSLMHFVFLSFSPKEQACNGDNLDCHRKPDTLNLNAAQAQK